MRDLDPAPARRPHVHPRGAGAAIGVLRETAVTVAYGGVADVTTGEPASR